MLMRAGAPTSRNRMRLRLALVDFVWILIAPIIALALRDPRLLAWPDFPATLPDPYLFSAVTILCAIPTFLVFRLSDSLHRYFSVHDVMAIAAAVPTATAASSVILFTVTRLDGVPRSTPLIYALVLGAGVLVSRSVARFFITERAFAGVDPTALPDNLHKIILIGADSLTSQVIKMLEAQIPRTAQVVAVLDGAARNVGHSINGVRVVGAIQDLEPIIEEFSVHGVEVDRVWINDQALALSDAVQDEVASICERHEIACVWIAEAFGLTPKAPLLAREPNRGAGPQIVLSRYFAVKRTVDCAAAVVMLGLFAPLWVLVALIVLFDVGSPVLFWQERIGRGGRRFLVHKFRTYYAPFNSRGEPVPEEARLSRIGRFLRKTRLDELPQLLNILVGDMSLIGPRPLLPKDQPVDPSLRLLARPGITGWAQINGGNYITPEEKDALDAWYIKHASPKIDLKILIHTIIIALTGERLNRRAVLDALSWKRTLG